MTTTSPALTARTSSPASSTTPTASWPIGWPVSVRSIWLYGQRSLPQIHARVTRTTASVGSEIVASGTSSMRTSPAPNMTVARIVDYLLNSPSCLYRSGLDPRSSAHCTNLGAQGGITIVEDRCTILQIIETGDAGTSEKATMDLMNHRQSAREARRAQASRE